MFENIKNRISEQAQEYSNKPVADDTATIAEYAHLFQELDDLSILGEDGDNSRSIDILLDDNGSIEADGDDDLEIEEIGFNIETGNISTLSDAAVKTEYSTMKSKDDFFTESENLIGYDNESDDDYEARKNNYAEKQWLKYRQNVLQEGSFGYRRVNVTSDNVPSLATINFGEYKGYPYNVRMTVQHQVDRKGNLTQHQLESIYLAESCGLCKNLIDEVKKDLENRYHISESANIFDTIVPSIFIAPIDPIDKHSVIVGFKNDANLSGFDFYRFTNPVCEYDTSNTVLEHAEVERVDTDKIKNFSRFCIAKNAAILESAKENPCYHRIVQEAINIGNDGGDNSNNGDNNNDQNNNNNDQNNNPPADNNDNNGNDNNQQDETKTVEVGTNDVSDAIAQGVEDATTEPKEGEDSITDLPDDSEIPSMDDNTSTDDNGDMNNTDDGNEDFSNMDPDQALQDLNAEGNEAGALDDEGGNLDSSEIDVDNMSIDDMLKQGTEKLKGMSLGQLKEFLANNDNASIQEAFILTNANINDEVDVLLKKTLGILNDNKLEVSQIVTEFKKYGKKLNRVLSKASKAQKVYNANEIKEIKKLNKCVADLMVTIKASASGSEVQVIKRLLKAFTSQAAVVGKLVDKKKKSLPKASVKETKRNINESYEDNSTTKMSSFIDNFLI